MSPIKWRPEYSIGVPELDAHHQQLVRYIQLLAARDIEHPASFRKTIVRGLVGYTSYHFRAEEELMARTSFPEREAHRNEHDAFRQDVALFEELQGRGSARFERVLHFYLKDWLVAHILSSDKRFGEYLSAQAQPPPTGTVPPPGRCKR